MRMIPKARIKSHAIPSQ